LKKIFGMGYFDDIFGNSDSFSDNLKEGKDFYMEKGYRVMTESYLVNRGYCCSILAKSTEGEYGFKESLPRPLRRRGVVKTRRRMTLCDFLFVISYSLFS